MNNQSLGNPQNEDKVFDKEVQDLRKRILDISDLSEQDINKIIHHPDLRNLILELPEEMFSYLKQVFHDIDTKVQNIFSNQNHFQNWGKTVNTHYQKVIFPTDYDLQDQVAKISKFVQHSVAKGYNVRGSGLRHSWSNIYGDPNQRLVSFYPYQVSVGSSSNVEDYSIQGLKINQSNPNMEHLRMIRYIKQDPETKKHLVKVGAGVSNDQLRRWCIQNQFQIKSNTIIVEINFCGGLGTCSHGTGLNTSTLADYIYEVQFIDYLGQLRRVNDKELIKSVAGSLGLLGLIIYVTVEMEKNQVVQTLPRKLYKDDVIPYPLSLKNNANFINERMALRAKLGYQDDGTTWQEKLEKFKQAINHTYCQWFYFPLEGKQIFQNVWESIGQKSPQLLQSIQKKGANFMNIYPSGLMHWLSKKALKMSNLVLNTLKFKSIAYILMRNPYFFFPKEKYYLNYMDAVHFQRGVQNMRVRDFEAEINIPSINNEPDYDLLQQIWWAGILFCQQNKIVDMVIEMRLFRGSKAPLAPEYNYDYTCSIQILRTLPEDSQQNHIWLDATLRMFKIWKSILQKKFKDSPDKVLIRPHWGKEWDQVPQLKKHVFEDKSLGENIKKFWADYKKVAANFGFNAKQNFSTFSNQTYRQLFNKYISEQ